MSRRMVAPGVWADEGPRPAIRHTFHAGGPIEAKSGDEHRRSQLAEAQRRKREKAKGG